MREENSLYNLYEDAYESNKWSDYGKKKTNKDYNCVLKVIDLTNLLKEKRVDIGYVAMMISNCETQELGSGMKFNVNDYMQEITDCYNKHIAVQQNIEYKFLTQEEMKFVVNWLKRKK